MSYRDDHEAAVMRADAADRELVDGHVELDCHFDDNRLQGRIDFANCR